MWLITRASTNNLYVVSEIIRKCQDKRIVNAHYIVAFFHLNAPYYYLVRVINYILNTIKAFQVLVTLVWILTRYHYCSIRNELMRIVVIPEWLLAFKAYTWSGWGFVKYKYTVYFK